MRQDQIYIKRKEGEEKNSRGCWWKCWWRVLISWYPFAAALRLWAFITRQASGWSSPLNGTTTLEQHLWNTSVNGLPGFSCCWWNSFELADFVVGEVFCNSMLDSHCVLFLSQNPVSRVLENHTRKTNTQQSDKQFFTRWKSHSHLSGMSFHRVLSLFIHAPCHV